MREEISPAVFTDLRNRYAEPQRAYHTMQHINECFTHLANSGFGGNSELVLAIWFHDAIYDPTRTDNEERSANLAYETLHQYKPRHVARNVHDLVLTTKHPSNPQTYLEKLLVDIDLAILGSDPERFAEYERQIRKEYEHVPEELFREKRGEFLRTLLEKPIYHTPQFFALEAQAEDNIRNSLKQLRQPFV